MLSSLNLFLENKVENDLLEDLKHLCTEDMKYTKPEALINLNHERGEEKRKSKKLLNNDNAFSLFDKKTNNKETDEEVIKIYNNQFSVGIFS